MGLIEDFIARYTKEYDFYNQAARLASQVLEADLRASGVRSIVTYRAKDVSRLEEKCRHRCDDKQYKSVDDIYEDIVDLAGVRVALYFPGEQEQVEKAILRLFSPLETKRVFPDPQAQRPNKRFSGYSAAHYRVQLKEQEMGDPNKRYAKARIEIQVASVLMHAWSEVEHDLDYKQLGGDLSEQENSILDQLNGLVMAGEISLRMLQEAGENRVASEERKFLNHYELAAHLLSRVHHLFYEPVGDAGLGRVDDLFAMLVKIGKQTPQRLSPYLDSLHGNLEMRPLAEQVIDALLSEDSSRYKDYESLRGEAYTREDGRNREEAVRYREIGHFLASWVDLEKLLREIYLANGGDPNDRVMPTGRLLRNLASFDDATVGEIDLLRQVRNRVAHGHNTPSVDVLMECTERLKEVTERIKNSGGIG
ncbi:GTP pyrophosphokinase family protein [Streptomyces sp. NPDC056707]|uniref:GTP pyrophosphokinase n=1 Tax=Streptomyces sp. NPDC056707 TaxID=3345919 RepID=UPI0036C3F3F8